MAIEKIYKNGVVVAYRSNVYYKGKRYIDTRRQLKKEAELDELEQKKQLIMRSYFEPSRMTLDDGYDNYITLSAPKTLSPSSFKTAKSYYKNHIQPAFGFREMNSIKSNEIKYNPLEGVKKPPPNYKQIQTWTREECHKSLEIAKGYQTYITYWLALQFELRISEVQGLHWESIDFKEKLLNVEQAYHEADKKLCRLKSQSSRRSIPLSDQQISFLKEHRQNQEPDTKLVAANKKGGFLMKRNICRAMKRICERAEIKLITFHELRHTHATLMLELNEHIKIVQQRLGHAKAETIINVYSHVRPQVHQDSAQRFSDFFEIQ